MYAELILNDEELAALAERAASLANENQAPDLAQAIDQGCVAAALAVLRKVSHDAQAIAFWSVLGEVPGREAIAHRLAAINALGAVTDRYPLPSFEVNEGIPLTFHSTIAALRTEVAERAGAAGRGKEACAGAVPIVGGHYSASQCNRGYAKRSSRRYDTIQQQPLVYSTVPVDLRLGRVALPARKLTVQGNQGVLLEFTSSPDLARELRLRSVVSWFGPDREFWTVQARDVDVPTLIALCNSLRPYVISAAS